MKLLILAFGFTLPYHVMRCAARTGATIEVLGAGPARGLALSRFCHRLHRSNFDFRSDDPAPLVAEITALCAQRGFDAILPSDDVSTSLLITIRDRLPARVIPLPTRGVFDLLNDKSQFTRYCAEIGLPVPTSRLFADCSELRAALGSGAVALPLTLKPVNRSGSVGVLHMLSQRDLGMLDAVDYVPVLAQRHIIGPEIGISIFADRGHIDGYVVHSWNNHDFSVLPDHGLLSEIAKLVAALEFSGPADFDVMVESETGKVYLIECNPRFWYSMYLAMLSGLNFMALALAPPGETRATLAVETGVMRRRITRNLLKFWTNSRREWRLLGYQLGDPLGYLAERFNWFDDSHVAVAQHVLPPGEAESAGGAVSPSGSL